MPNFMSVSQVAPISIIPAITIKYMYYIKIPIPYTFFNSNFLTYLHCITRLEEHKAIQTKHHAKRDKNNL